MATMCRILFKFLHKQRRRKKVTTTSYLVVVAFFATTPPHKKTTTHYHCFLFSNIKKKATIGCYRHLLCNKTTIKTIEKNEKKGRNLPLSSCFYLFISGLMFQVCAFNSHFRPLASSFKFQAFTSSFSKFWQWSERKMR